jgi:poly-gamma-glutamate synthesis protein (capsule biosynthesis protein)
VTRTLVVVAGLALLAAGASQSSATGFRGSISRIPASLRAHMTSWHPGCPVPPSRLRLLRVTYVGFDRLPHQGRLVVSARWARPILRVMRRLYEEGFPIRRMRLPEAYGSNDDRMDSRDDSSGFNCRLATGSSSWSEHAYGRAIDLNPRENPYVAGSHVGPPSGRAFVDRSRHVRGMIHPGDGVVRAFRSIGWGWGGRWRYPIDYMHFSSTGR